MLRAHKQLVRTRIAARLRSVPPPEVQRQSADGECETISSHVHRRAKNVAVFVSMPNSEIDTREILEELLRPGSSRKCFLPKVSNEQNIMNMLQVHSIAELDAFPVHHKFKIPEPPNDGKRENAFDSGLDLVLVPGMAFGKRCTRLGHGKGYYDRFIATMRHQAEKRNPDEPRYPTLVGLALNEQMYDFVPVEKNDEILNQIIWAEPEKPLGEYDELTRDLHT